MKIIRVVLAVGLMVSAFGATGDVRRQETERIQREIDRVSEGGGGRVVIEKGIHPCGTLYLKNGVDLHLEEGAVLSGGSRSEDYEDAIPLREIYSYVDSQTDTMTRKAFVYAENATNIAITGKGMINGCGQQFFDQKTWAKPTHLHRPRMVMFLKCRGIRFEDTTFKDSPLWAMWLRRCDDIVMSRIRIDADQRMINTDGIDIDACRRVRVGDSFFSTGDDCLVLRAIFHKGDTAEAVTEDVVVSNCCLSTTCQGVRIACPSDRVIRNAVFRDMTFTGRNAIFADQQRWYLEAGNTGNITTSNILFENWKIDCWGHPVILAVEKDINLRDFGGFTFRNIEVKSGAPVTAKVYRTDTLAGEWKLAAEKEIVIGGSGTELRTAVEGVDMTSGFYRVEIVK